MVQLLTSYTLTLTATVHSVTDGQTVRQTTSIMMPIAWHIVNKIHVQTNSVPL